MNVITVGFAVIPALSILGVAAATTASVSFFRNACTIVSRISMIIVVPLQKKLRRVGCSFPSVYTALIHFLGMPFGRDKYTVAELRPHVPLAFEYLERTYFNRVRRQYKDKIASMTDVARLACLLIEFQGYGYHSSVLKFAHKRLQELDPVGGIEVECVALLLTLLPLNLPSFVPSLQI